MYRMPVFLSNAARNFFARWGRTPGAQDDYDRDVVTCLAASRERKSLVSLDSLLRHSYAPDHDSTGICLGALHEAVDMLHWAKADALLRYPVKRSHLLMALGTLLSHGEYLGYAHPDTRKEHEYSLRLLQRLNGVTQEECQYLLSQAFNGSALAFHLPLMLNGAVIPPAEEWGNTQAEHIWYNWLLDDETSPDATRMRLFYSERLPRLLEQHRHHFPDFPVQDGKLYFTGNPADRLPMLHVRRQRTTMKDLERAILLLAQH